MLWDKINWYNDNMYKIVLVGSGEFTSSMYEVDKFLISQFQKKIKIMIVPTAAGREKDYRKWILNGKEHFDKLNTESLGVDIVKREDAFKNDYIKLLDEVDFVYFSGGDPIYLLNTLKDTTFLNAVIERYKNNKVIIVGSSAGAMMMGSFIPSNLFRNLITMKGLNIEWNKSLDLVNFTVIPHFDRFSKMLNFNIGGKYFKNKFMENLKGTIIGIDEDTALVSKDGVEFKVLGKSYVHIFTQNSDDKEYKSGDMFKIV